jgi:hypothetical protein
MSRLDARGKAKHDAHRTGDFDHVLLETTRSGWWPFCRQA